MEGIVPYTKRHLSRIDRLSRSVFLLDYTLARMNVLLPLEEAETTVQTTSWPSLGNLDQLIKPQDTTMLDLSTGNNEKASDTAEEQMADASFQETGRDSEANAGEMENGSKAPKSKRKVGEASAAEDGLRTPEPTASKKKKKKAGQQQVVESEDMVLDVVARNGSIETTADEAENGGDSAPIPAQKTSKSASKPVHKKKKKNREDRRRASLGST